MHVALGTQKKAQTGTAKEFDRNQNNFLSPWLRFLPISPHVHAAMPQFYANPSLNPSPISSIATCNLNRHKI